MSRRKSGKKNRGSALTAPKMAGMEYPGVKSRIDIPEKSAGEITASAESTAVKHDPEPKKRVTPEAAAQKTAARGKAPQAENPKKKGGEQRPAVRNSVKPGIGPAVFLPCLFMALVLGIYLGTLLPDMYARIGKNAQVAQVAPQMPAMPPAKPAPKPAQNSMESRIASLVSRTTVNPGDLQAWVELGNSYFDANQPPKAIEAYRRAIELDPKNADVLTDMGIMYRETGDFEKAVQSFRMAREADPRHINSMFNEGVVLLNDLKRPKDARAAWQRLLDVNPEARSPDGKRVADMIGQLE